MGFKPDYAGIGRMLNNRELLGPALLGMAEKVKAEAEATAPYDPKNTTHFRDAFDTSIGTDSGTKGDRVAGIVRNHDDAALSIETGTSDTPAHNTLTNALDVLRGA